MGSKAVVSQVVPEYPLSFSPLHKGVPHVNRKGIRGVSFLRLSSWLSCFLSKKHISLAQVYTSVLHTKCTAMKCIGSVQVQALGLHIECMTKERISSTSVQASGLHARCKANERIYLDQAYPSGLHVEVRDRVFFNSYSSKVQASGLYAKVHSQGAHSLDLGTFLKELSLAVLRQRTGLVQGWTQLC